MSKEAWILIFIVMLVVFGLAGDFASKYGFRVFFARFTRGKIANKDDQAEMDTKDGSR